MKKKLEEKQRQRRKDLEEKQGTHVPIWFTEETDADGNKEYKYKGGYFEKRGTGEWHGCETDLF